MERAWHHSLPDLVDWLDIGVGLLGFKEFGLKERSIPRSLDREEARGRLPDTRPLSRALLLRHFSLVSNLLVLDIDGVVVLVFERFDIAVDSAAPLALFRIVCDPLLQVNSF